MQEEVSKGAQVYREEVSRNSLSDCVLPTSRQVPDGESGDPEFLPRENVGNSPFVNGCNGFGSSSPRQVELPYEEVPSHGSGLVELRRIGSSYDVEEPN